MASEAETLGQLNSARDIVLRDHTLYPQVVPGIVQVVGASSSLGLRRWGAEFLAESFASQVVTPQEKQQMAPFVLDTLSGYLGRKETLGEEEDSIVVKSAVQCAASVYPYIFRHTVTTPADSGTWTKISSIKSSILRRMDNAVPGVRVCCIKFVASVVLTQTPSVIADPRRPEYNEISLSLVPRDHPTIPPANLEAEASGLLDRLLGVLQDNLFDALVVTATLNSLAILVQQRASIAAKIISTVLGFNPLMVARRPISGQDKIAIRSMTRTTVSFLQNYIKRIPGNAGASRIQQHVDRLRHGLTEVFLEPNQLKRPAPEEPIDGLDDAKRQKLTAQAERGVAAVQQPTPNYKHLASGPITLAQVYTLTNDAQSATFDVKRMDEPIVLQLIPALLQAITPAQIEEALKAVRGRWLDLQKQPLAPTMVATKTTAPDDDDDDYDPSADFGGDSQQSSYPPNPVSAVEPPSNFAIGPFNLPPPPSLTDQERGEYSQTALTRVMGTLTALDQESRTKSKLQEELEKGFNRGTGHDRDGWLTLLTRLATRAPFDLHDAESKKEQENDDRSLVKRAHAPDLARKIRETLFAYVMENFRSRIDVATAWLTEEWYNDQLLHKQQHPSQMEATDGDLPNYWDSTYRLIDAMAPYLDIKDGRILIRLLSEIPAISRALLQRLKDIALDPERVQVSTNTLLYLIMFRPPARDMAIDCAEEMYKENSDAKMAAKKILAKWRPSALEQEAAPEVKAEG